MREFVQPRMAKHRAGSAIGYADPAYWDALYQGKSEDALFEWYLDAAQLAPMLWPLLPATRATDVVEVGCGTRPLLPGLKELRPSSFGRLVATDLSDAAVARAGETAGPGIECRVADARATGLEAESWDIVLDKATCDAMMSSAEHGPANVAALSGEAARLLRPGGCLVVVTHTQPDLHLEGEEPEPESDARPLIRALIEGACASAPTAHWSVEAHVPDPEDCPRVLVLRKRARRVSRGRRPAASEARDVRCRLV